MIVLALDMCLTLGTLVSRLASYNKCGLIEVFAFRSNQRCLAPMKVEGKSVDCYV